MAINLPAPPYKTPMTDRNGILSQAWVGWFREMFRRIGGTSALSNEELAALPDTLSASVTALETLTSSHSTSITALQLKDNDFGQGPVL